MSDAFVLCRNGQREGDPHRDVAQTGEAARVSDRTAFFYLGELIEYDKTNIIFTNPSNKQTENYITGRFG